MFFKVKYLTSYQLQFYKKRWRIHFKYLNARMIEMFKVKWQLRISLALVNYTESWKWDAPFCFCMEATIASRNSTLNRELFIVASRTASVNLLRLAAKTIQITSASLPRNLLASLDPRISLKSCLNESMTHGVRWWQYNCENSATFQRSSM